MVPNQLNRRHNLSINPSRLRHVETRLQADAEAVLREIAYVLALTQRVKREILNDCPEEEPAAV